MKDTITKLRNLLSMKSTLLDAINRDLDHARATVEALRNDLEHAVRIIRKQDHELRKQDHELYVLRNQLVEQQQQWWTQQDQDEQWLADYLAREDDVIAARHIAEQRGVPIDEEEM